MLMGMSTRILYKATNVNGYLAILIGAGLTILVQSSSITTSALTPFVGMGALRLEQMFPLTLGANIGTTVTGLLASLVSDGTNALQVALCHLFFNISGIIIWYPVPFMLLGLSSLFMQGSKGFTVLGSLITVVLILFIIYIVYKWYKGGLKESMVSSFEAREKKNKAIKELPDDMDYLKSEIVRLREHTGLPEPVDEKEADDSA